MAQTDPAPIPFARRRWQLTFATRQRLVVGLFGLLLIGAVGFTLSWHSETTPVAHQSLGEAAQQDVVASRALQYDSVVQRTAAADRAAASTDNIVYTRDTQAIERMQGNYASLVAQITTQRAAFAVATTQSARDAVSDALSKIVAPRLVLAQVLRLLSMVDSDWQTVQTAGQESLTSILSQNIMPGGESTALDRLHLAVYVPSTISATLALLSDQDRAITVALVQPFIGPTMMRDEAATKQKQDEARAKVPPVTVNIVAGQIIVRRGDIITAEALEAMDRLGLNTGGVEPTSTAGTVGIITLLVVALLAYFGRIGSIGNSDTSRRAGLPRLRLLLFLGVGFWIAAAAARLTLSSSFISPGNLLSGVQQFIFPLATIAMMLAVLFDLELAIFFTALIALLTGFVGGGVEPAALYFAGGLAGALTIWRAERFASFGYAGAAVAIAEFLTSICFGLTERNLDPWRVVQLATASTINGLLSTSLAFFGFSLLGRLFGVTTVLQLLELAHPSQPLLKRLMLEAPGTYHHSMLVGTLAEQAAGAVGADPLLARVGAYFHDIGKLSRPTMFIENQEGGPNPHDGLDPLESRDVLRAHVVDGVALARKYGLPRRVADIIGQHHGITIMSYFYDRAQKENMSVDQADFRYPGPRPQTKEAAIVMLSDSVEAAVRAGLQSGQVSITSDASVPAAETQVLALPNTARPRKTIRNVVDQIIGDRIADGQLDECNLTLRDIDAIRRVFTVTLAGIHHARVVYPEPAKNMPVPPLNVRVLTPTVPTPADGSGDVIETAPALSGPAATPDPIKPPKSTTRIGRAGSAIVGPTIDVDAHQKRLEN